MKRHHLTAVAFAAAVALAAPSAWAQGRPVGTPTGSAQPRGGGDGGSSGGTALPRSGGSGGGSMGSPSMPASMSAPTFSRPSAPSAEPLAFAPQRRGGGEGGSSTGGHAVPRGSSGSGDGGSGGTRAPSTAGSGSGDRSGNQGAVPTYSRPRGERPVRGEAVPRTGPRPGTGSGGGYILPGYYYPYSYYYRPFGYYGYGPGYGLGLGYFYDPFWSPYGSGFYGPYGGYGAYGYPYQGYYGGGSYDRDDRDEGAVRLKLKPREAQVYVDGYLAGEVDSFDGAFQKLNLPAGGHRIELKAPGYEPLHFDVLITPGETVTYKGEMKATN
jgi:hypothetical protein